MLLVLLVLVLGAVLVNCIVLVVRVVPTVLPETLVLVVFARGIPAGVDDIVSLLASSWEEMAGGHHFSCDVRVGSAVEWLVVGGVVECLGGEGELEIPDTFQKFVRVQALRVLGLGLDSQGSTQAMISFRHSEIRNVWFRHRAQLHPAAGAPGSHIPGIWR